jgi:amino acid adenylation domain-containing protein/FkbH-like protein
MDGHSTESLARTPAQAVDSAAAPAAAALRPIVVTATFTANPVERPLNYWMQQLDIAASVTLAPYAQVLQELLDPHSASSLNNTGFNVFLIRGEDWIRNRLHEHTSESNLQHLRSVAQELVDGVEKLRARTSAPVLIILCPSSSLLGLEYRETLQAIQQSLADRLRSMPHVHCWTHEDVLRLYPVADYEDPRSDRLGHIPYTIEYFAAMATLLARRMAAHAKPPFKVIAVDCDNTLWRGVCGELGPSGIELTEEHLLFQKMLVRQHDAGMLLCVCSKNNPADVQAVFQSHPEMPLREEHLVGSRINWSAKSSNLQALAEDLDLSPDSFVFIDDSALECAEVRAHAPGVLALHFPQTPEAIRHFIEHTWAFDRVGVTEEARQRTLQYKQNRARAQLLRESGDLTRFLQSLHLQVDCSPLAAEHLPRVAELIQRTNQFNLTSLRRRASDLEALWKSGEIRGFVVHVRDRFGDYGLVGAVLVRTAHAALEVDTFVLSCRVLGRGVEHRIVNQLGRYARELGLSSVLLRYRPTPRSEPARQFLEESLRAFRTEVQTGSDALYSVPVGHAESLGMGTAQSGAPIAELAKPLPKGRLLTGNSAQWHEAASRLSRVEDLIKALELDTPRPRDLQTEYIAPASPIEEAVAGIWRTVLGVEPVGTRDDFFELGGDSLMAVRTLASIGSVLGLELSLQDFFEGPTIREVVQHLAKERPVALPIEPGDRMRPIPLSWAQQRLWFIHRLENGSAAYHLPFALRLRGQLDQDALEWALDRLLARHEALRTSFIMAGSAPIQRITTAASIALQTADLSTCPLGGSDAKLLRELRDRIAAPFDLGGGALIRAALLKLSEDDHVLLVTLHHIISDGWSVGLLIREWLVLYALARHETDQSDRRDPLPPLPIQYADYARWQRQMLSVPALEQQLAFWKQHLQGAPALLELPTDRPRPAVQSYRGDTVSFTIGAHLASGLKALARRFNLTLAMALHTAWAILLYRLSGQEDVVIGVPVANRRRTELEGLVGLFVNTLAVRVRLDGDRGLSEVLGQVKAVLLGAYAYQDTPFEKVVEALQPARSLSHSPIFQVMLAFQEPHGPATVLPDLTVSRMDVPLDTAQFDLLLSLEETEGGIRGHLNYASDLFDATTIERWLAAFETLLAGMVADPRRMVDELPILTDGERQQVIQTFNATRTPFPRGALLHGLFEDQVRRTPGAIAVQYEGGACLTYAELNAKANQLAHFLRRRGVAPDQLVGVCLERSLEMVIALLGVLKAGGAYVPLDPSYPSERLGYMLADCAPGVLLTQEQLQDRLPQVRAQMIDLDRDWAEIERYPRSDLDSAALGLNSSNLAYMIYTSGSTGRPKGAMNEHRGIVNRLHWMQCAYQIGSSDRVLQKTPFSFDVSVWEFFWTLLNGARLIMARPGGHKDPAYLQQIIEATGVTTLHFVPSMLQVFLDQHEPGRCPSICHVVCSGEELPAALQRKCFECLPQAALSNLYGPTEAAVDVTAWECRSEDRSHRVPIGHPIANIRIYVLDRRGQPVPVGVSGEIFIAGVGVGRGYLNRTELTAERFLRDPFEADADARMYRTGDVGRWRPDGAIEYLGRNDQQVKIRGFRIELGEIEAQLRRRPDIREVAVVVREDVPGEKRLIAYVVPTDPAGDNAERAELLRSGLKAELPDYMIPAAFVTLGTMPLSPNGKLDRQALPKPERDAYASRRYEAPEGELEEVLAGIWQELLKVDRVSRLDNFFELGGHSLLIVQLLERLRRVGLSAQVRDVFASQTLGELAGLLRCGAADRVAVAPNLIPPEAVALEPQMLPLVQLEPEHIDWIVRHIPGGVSNVQDVYPLAPLQEGILFHYLLNPDGGDTYVVPTLLEISSRQRLIELVSALQRVIERHDVFRTAVLWEEVPKPLQVVYRRATLPVREVALDSQRDIREQLDQWMRPEQQQMDLREAPLLRLKVAADPHSPRWYALLQIHHIIGDDVSQENVAAEVRAHLEGRAHQLPPSAPYRNHVAQSLSHALAHDAEAYFRSKLGEIEEPTAPFGLLDIQGDGSRLEEARDVIDLELGHRVRHQARRLGVSTATVFHAAWALVVARTSGRADAVFGSVLLGRLQGEAGSLGTLGMFINTLPLRIRLASVSARELVEQTQRELIELLTYEQASLAVAQRCSGITGSAPLFTALLNYRHRRGAAEARWDAAEGIRVLASHDRTNYPVVLSVDDLEERFELLAQTDQRIQPQRLNSYLRTALESLLNALESAPQKPAVLLEVLPDSEKSQVLHLFNDTRRAYRSDRCVHELVEEQAARSPDAVALECAGQAMTYRELNHRANRLARILRRRGARPDQILAVYMERSAEMVVSLLAVLKSGGAYLPIDVKQPEERVRYMLAESSPLVILTQESHRDRLHNASAALIVVESTGVLPAGEEESDLLLEVRPEHLLFVIYTSGSTGAPKGVMVTHGGMVSLMQWHTTTFELSPNSRCPSMAAVGFDAAAWEIWPTLAAGARLVLAPPETAGDTAALINWWADQELQVSFLTTAVAEMVLTQNTYPRGLRALLLGGEALRHRPGSLAFSVVNNYGPTETTVICTSGRIAEYDEVLHIGRPIANTRIYILDKHLQPVPVGVTGEMFVAGVGVARGYLNRPDLTAERFIKDPFDADSEARMYKTGDLARWLPNGTVEFAGRNDSQVKIRGFRIELGEIEAQLLRLEDVKEALVVTRDVTPADKQLVAYLVPTDCFRTLSVEELRAHLKSMLPEYMVPVAFVVLPALPLTANGKVDRRALPAPDLGAYVNRAYEAPVGELEETLAGIWESLLGVPRVGRWDNFFELGGHSLVIVQLLERLRRVGLSAQVRAIFDCPTLADLAVALTSGATTHFEVPPNLIPDGCELITPQMLPLVELQREQIQAIVRTVPGGAANVQDVYPLAPLQEGILFHHLLDKEDADPYVIPMLIGVSGKERLDELARALQKVINRHDALRTAVLWEELPYPVQVVYREAHLPVEHLDLDPQRDAVEQIREHMRPERQLLDLRQAPPLRLKVAPVPGTEKSYALLQIHHLVCDNKSLDTLLAEVMAHMGGRGDSLPVPVSYRNHVAQALAHAKANNAESFFKRKLGDVEEPTAPFGLMDVREGGRRIDTARLHLERSLGDGIRTQARKLGVTTATVFHAAWALVVARTSGRDDVVFGSVLLGRLHSRAGAQRVVGMFINTLPLRLRLEGQSARALVHQTQRELMELFNHEQASLAVAQRCSGIPASAPLFSALMNYRHGVSDLAAELGSESGLELLGGQSWTNYPVMLSVDERAGEFLLTADTDRRIDPGQVLAYMQTALKSLYEALENRTEEPCLSLPLLPQSELDRVLRAFNDTQAPYARDRLVHELVEDQVWRSPQAIAVRCEGASLTYSELNTRANQIARALLARGIRTDERVAICFERGLDMVVGLLGILKAGGAYVPLDPSYPAERLQHMLADAAPALVLTQETLLSRLPATPAPTLTLDEARRSMGFETTSNPSRPESGVTPRSLVYVIYTSGSTGRPKGIAMPHRAMVNLLEWHRQNLNTRPGERVLQFAALSFDVAFQEIFSTLALGGTLELLDEWVRRDARALAELMVSRQISRLFVPPLMLQSLAEQACDREPVSWCLRDVITAGEQLRITAEISRFFRRNPGCRLHNHYGPTETHVVTALTLPSDPQNWRALPSIGTPIANTRIYILNRSLQPVPPGVPGEIFISGAGVARGYLNRPQLTSERFIKDPFAEADDARMYRTGDLGCWRPDGTLDYLGRNDDQVKIRGYRVELGEIGAQLALHPQVQETAVIAREDHPGEKQVVAYVVPQKGVRLTGESLRAHLKSRLPEFMVPAAFVSLESLPLTPNGKLDRRTLPAPEPGACVSREYEPPRGEIEATLAEIWQALLKVNRVGRKDNFFELGGHSLLATRVITRIGHVLDVDLPLRVIFERPTIESLSREIVQQIAAELALEAS